MTGSAALAPFARGPYATWTRAADNPFFGAPSRKGKLVPDFAPEPRSADAERLRLQALIGVESADGAGVIADPLECLCRSVTAELSLAGAAVTLMPTVGTHAVTATSSESMREFEEEQFAAGEGPTQDAYSSGRPVLAANLSRASFDRWPGYGPAALAAGIGAIYAFPLRVGATIFGALTLYLPEPRSLDRQEMRMALIFSELATEFLLDRSSGAPAGHLDPSDHAALATHGHIYQAQGMVMVDLGVPLPEALARLRAHAYATEQDLARVATEIIAGRIRLERDGE